LQGVVFISPKTAEFNENIFAPDNLKKAVNLQFCKKSLLALFLYEKMLFGFPNSILRKKVS